MLKVALALGWALRWPIPLRCGVVGLGEANGPSCLGVMSKATAPSGWLWDVMEVLCSQLGTGFGAELADFGRVAHCSSSVFCGPRVRHSAFWASLWGTPSL